MGCLTEVDDPLIFLLEISYCVLVCYDILISLSEIFIFYVAISCFEELPSHLFQHVHWIENKYVSRIFVSKKKICFTEYIFKNLWNSYDTY